MSIPLTWLICRFMVQAILCRYQSDSKKHVPLLLSKDHNPSNYEERMRIQKAGGSVRSQILQMYFYVSFFHFSLILIITF